MAEEEEVEEEKEDLEVKEEKGMLITNKLAKKEDLEEKEAGQQALEKEKEPLKKPQPKNEHS